MLRSTSLPRPRRQENDISTPAPDFVPSFETSDTTAASTPVQRPVIVWDVVVSICLILVGFGLDALLTFGAVFLVMASDSCPGSDCNIGLLETGVFVSGLGPTVVLLIATVVAIVLMVKRRLSFWVPISGMVVAVGVWAIGFALVSTAVA